VLCISAGACFRANSDSAIHAITPASPTSPVPQNYPSMNSSPSPTSNGGRTGMCHNNHQKRVDVILGFAHVTKY